MAKDKDKKEKKGGLFGRIFGGKKEGAPGQGPAAPGPKRPQPRRLSKRLAKPYQLRVLNRKFFGVARLCKRRKHDDVAEAQ